MSRALLVSAIVLVAALSGCFGKSKSDLHDVATTPSASPEPAGTDMSNGTYNATTPTSPPSGNNSANQTGNQTNPPAGNSTNSTANQTVTLAFTSVPEAPNTTQALFFEWRGEASGFSNSTVNATKVNLWWGNQSIPDENLTGPNATRYPHQTTNQSGDLPKDFNATVHTVEAGTYYFRAHALVGTQEWWSSETAVNVAQGRTGKVVKVSIGGVGNGYGQLSTYSPDPVTVKPGDAINWTNSDLSGETHSATNDSASAFAFDSGLLAKGQSSGPILFTTLGTFTYHCQVHPDMTGTVTVKA